MREYAHIADEIAARRVGPVLDWGCGWGQVSHLLLERGVEVESFDYREGEQPRTVQLEAFPEITALISGDPVALPYPDDHFEAVLSCGVLEHVQYPQASLEELHRVLRPGGRLLVYKLPNRFSYLELLARPLGLYYHGRLAHDRVYDRRRAVDLLRRCGFRIDAFRRTNMLPLTLTGGFASRHAERIWQLNRSLARIPLLNLAATNVELEATAVDAAASRG
jgi:ubiquinone/menaquinone biosynthesis C-methylase UbiE